MAGETHVGSQFYPSTPVANSVLQNNHVLEQAVRSEVNSTNRQHGIHLDSKQSNRSPIGQVKDRWGTVKYSVFVGYLSIVAQDTVNPAGPVFHLFSVGNPDFIIYMAELRVDEFGMNFWLQCSKHLRYGFHI